MDAVQKDHWYFVVLIFLPFLKVAVQQNEVVTVRLEEGMVLDCLCPWEGNLSLVSWTRIPDKNPVAIFHPDLGLAFSHQYLGRVEFLKTTPMDGSISIRNVTHQDIGTYSCSVQTFPRGPWTRNIQVEDLDEPPKESQEEHEVGVDSPTPEVIVADVELVAVQNNNITITCNHTHNGTVYQSMLERMPYHQLWSIIGVCKQVEGDLVSEDYSDRGQVICEDSLDVQLHLTGVVQDDGGLYRCTFNTDLGMQTSTVLLTVVTQGWFSLSIYMMCIYTLAGTTGIILFAFFLTFAIRQNRRRKKKNWREEYRVKLQPAQRQKWRQWQRQ
ncbi:CD226 antigen isoform X2 [Cynoglossus semilaevis]|uniref:CD226 antigen isoform X2 n=1 Tax=Cynoglossus semilaevis TaxID=244447 RepID=UPI0007DCA544|nr:CD226 antigen isoform X2 [Cynoglossus semilaevis]